MTVVSMLYSGAPAPPGATRLVFILAVSGFFRERSPPAPHAPQHPALRASFSARAGEGSRPAAEPVARPHRRRFVSAAEGVERSRPRGRNPGSRVMASENFFVRDERGFG